MTASCETKKCDICQNWYIKEEEGFSFETKRGNKVFICFDCNLLLKKAEVIMQKPKNAWRGDFTIIINGKPELINVYCSECKKPQKKFKLPYLTSDIEGEWTETMIECENPMCNHSTFIIKKIITKEEKTNVES